MSNLSSSVGGIKDLGVPAIGLVRRDGFDFDATTCVIRGRVNIPSSHDSRTAACPDDSPFSIPPLGTGDSRQK